MFDSLGSWSKPVSGHRFHKTPFSYSSMSSNSHYVAERAFRQRLDGLHYKVVYCPVPGLMDIGLNADHSARRIPVVLAICLWCELSSLGRQKQGNRLQVHLFK